MSVLAFLFDIKKIWQRNDQTISGDKWIQLQDLFMDQILIQFENKSKKFSQNTIEFTFLPDESVPMQYRLKEFLQTIFLLENSHSFFNSEIVHSCLKVTISREKLTALVASANIRRQKPKLDDVQIEERVFTRSTSTVIENKVCKKRKREEDKEKAIEDFIKYLKDLAKGNQKTFLSKKKIPKSEFRSSLNDFLNENKIKIYFYEPVLDEILNRLYPNSVSSNEYVTSSFFNVVSTLRT